MYGQEFLSIRPRLHLLIKALGYGAYRLIATNQIIGVGLGGVPLGLGFAIDNFL